MTAVTCTTQLTNWLKSVTHDYVISFASCSRGAVTQRRDTDPGEISAAKINDLKVSRDRSETNGDPITRNDACELVGRRQRERTLEKK